MVNPILVQRLFVASSLGVGYFIYRKFLSATMINQNFLVNNKQLSELKTQNYTYGSENKVIAGHSVNKIYSLNDKQKVVIIGAGIIGIAQSLKLLREGYSVILIEKDADVGLQTSYYNGCAYVPLSPKTLINPSNMWLLIKNIFKNPEETTLRFNANAFFEKYLMIWGVNALLLAGTNNQVIKNSEKQVQIGKMNVEEVRKLRSTGLFDGEFNSQGLIGFFNSEKDKNSLITLLDHHKIVFSDIKQLQDTLGKKYQEQFKVGIHLHEGNTLDTHEICQRMVDYCLDRFPNDFYIANNTMVKGFLIDPKSRVQGVLTNSGIIFGDKFIISMAHKTKYLTDKLGIRFPIMPVKGWVIGVDINNQEESILRNYTFFTPNYYSTFVNGRLRLSGCAEIGSDFSENIPQEEWGAKQIINNFNKHTGMNISLQDCFVRTCYRPVTPDDVPVISKVPNFQNVYINTGHGSKGTSYCFGSAEILFQIMSVWTDFIWSELIYIMNKLHNSFYFSNLIKTTRRPNKFILFFLLGSSVYAFDKVQRYLAFNSNTFLTTEQIRDLSIKNSTLHNNEIINAHAINQKNTLKSREKIVIIGGGLVGLTQALKLLQNGHNVTILEQNDMEIAQNNIFDSNIFNPLYFLPLINRANLIEMMQNTILTPENQSKLIRFNFNSFILQNFLTFTINALFLSMTDAQQRHNARTQFIVGGNSLSEVEQIRKTGIFQGGHFQAKGQLAFFSSYEETRKFNQQIVDLGIPHIPIDNIAKLEQYLNIDLGTEPNISVFNRYKRALVLVTESNLENNVLYRSLQDYCQQNYKRQFSIAYSTKVANFVINEQNEVKGVNSNKGVVLGDRFILCMAHQTKYLAEKLKLALPILPAKGWAMGANVPEGPDFSFIRHFTLNTPNYFATVTMDKLRLTGGVEICKDTPSQDASTEWGAIQILNRFNEQTGYSMRMSDFSVKNNYYSITPDDIPIICQVPKFNNVYINAGFGNRASSLCFGAANIIFQIMEGSKDFEDLNLDRFYFL